MLVWGGGVRVGGVSLSGSGRPLVGGGAGVVAWSLSPLMTQLLVGTSLVDNQSVVHDIQSRTS